MEDETERDPNTPFIEAQGFYSYKDELYRVTRYEPDIFMTKDPTSGNWSNAVEYVPARVDEGDDALVFVRQEKDFEGKFERAENPNPTPEMN